MLPNQMLISDIVRYGAIRNPNDRALIYEGREWSYRELETEINLLANGLAALGEPGDRVAILADNLPEYVFAYYGVPLSGRALNLLNYRLLPKDIDSIVRDCEAKIIIIEPKYLRAMREAGFADYFEHIIITGDETLNDVDRADDRIISYADLVREASTDRPELAEPTDLAWLIYTSGTTGPPKGVMHSHQSLLWAVVNGVSAWEQPEPDSATLMPWPMCHISGFGVFVAHSRRLPMILMRSYEPERFLSLIDEHRITDLSMAPTMLSMLLRHPRIDEFDLSSVRRIGYGAAAMPEEVLRRGMERFSRSRFFTGFGMTELGGNVLYQSADAHRRALENQPELLLSIGRPMPFGTVRVVDEAMNDVPVGVIGEMVIHGPQVMVGYWGMPEATEEAFAGGWFHTGDLARLDAEGNIYIVDRKKDMIITGGENVSSREVEEAVYRHPSVAEAAVVGEPDSEWGERIVAFVQLREGCEPDADSLLAHCRGELAGFKMPRRIVFVDDLPRNAAGKVLKRDLRLQARTPQQ